jgi:hypothetical protein
MKPDVLPRTGLRDAGLQARMRSHQAAVPYVARSTHEAISRLFEKGFNVIEGAKISGRKTNIMLMR